MAARVRYENWSNARVHGDLAHVTHLPAQPDPRQLTPEQADELARRTAARLPPNPHVRVVDGMFVRSPNGQHWNLRVLVVPHDHAPTPYAAPIPVLLAAHAIGKQTPNSPHLTPHGCGSYQTYTTQNQPNGRVGGDWTLGLPENVRQALRRIETVRRDQRSAVATVQQWLAAEWPGLTH